MNHNNSGPTTDVPQLVERWRLGDQDAATQLYERYQHRLLLLVSGHLNERLQRRMDANELVQSIMKSAFRVTSQKDIGCQDESGFWKWLVTVALNKTFKRIDRETAEKRDPKREVGTDSVLGDRVINEPTPDDVVEVSELLEKILERLTDEQGKILLAKLNGQNHAEIAAELGISTKTVQRTGHAIRQAAMEILGSEVPDWLIEDTQSPADQLQAQLRTSLSRWLSDNSGTARASRAFQSATLEETLEASQPDLNDLRTIQAVSKQQGAGAGDKTAKQVYGLIYLRAIAAARLNLQINLSSHPDEKLKANVDVFLAKDWVPAGSKAVLKKFSQFLG